MVQKLPVAAADTCSTNEPVLRTWYLQKLSSRCQHAVAGVLKEKSHSSGAAADTRRAMQLLGSPCMLHRQLSLQTDTAIKANVRCAAHIVYSFCACLKEVAWVP